jgi:hypothetical protein
MIALQLGAGELLGIDSRQIGGLLVPRTVAAGVVHDVLLYDQVAGGSGHCRALLERWPELLDAAWKRLSCSNARCVNGCHRCLIAYETQRYEDMMRRSALRAFLEPRWQVIKEQPKRDGMTVGALFRGGAEVREALARAEGGQVTVIVHSITGEALDVDGWLPLLLRHADGRGQVRLVVECLPDPNSDADRFLAARLRIAVAGGRLELLTAKKGVSATPWRITVDEPAHAFFVEQSEDNSLGPSWLREGAAIYQAMGADARRTILERTNALVAGCRTVRATDLEPDPPKESTTIHWISVGQTGAEATFAHWFRGTDGTSLFDKPLAELHIADPYLASEWQLRLLTDLVKLAKQNGVAKLRVSTYPPKEEGNLCGPNRTVTAEEQQRIVAELTGDRAWQPLPLPKNSIDRMHKRVVTGRRTDGTRFEVLLERGIDFIVERRGGRSTRETYLVVRDPVD